MTRSEITRRILDLKTQYNGHPDAQVWIDAYTAQLRGMISATKGGTK